MYLYILKTCCIHFFIITVHMAIQTSYIIVWETRAKPKPWQRPGSHAQEAVTVRRVQSRRVQWRDNKRRTQSRNAENLWKMQGGNGPKARSKHLSVGSFNCSPLKELTAQDWKPWLLQATYDVATASRQSQDWPSWTGTYLLWILFCIRCGNKIADWKFHQWKSFTN